MITSFEIKSYPQLQWLLGAVNFVILSVLFIAAYFWLLIPDDVTIVNNWISKLSSNSLIALVPLTVLALIWSWLSTQLLRFHDRWHEPHIFAWRATYDTDLILRSVLQPLHGQVPPGFFNRAFDDKKFRDRCLQRLFYNFVGDETKTAEGRRLFFYSEMGRFWTVALIDFYAILFLLLGSVYGWIRGVSLAPVLVIIPLLAMVVSRITMNKVLERARQITVEQIDAIIQHHLDQVKLSLSTLLSEL